MVFPTPGGCVVLPRKCSIYFKSPGSLKPNQSCGKELGIVKVPFVKCGGGFSVTIFKILL